ncbi:MAG TPA: hypothetical protein VI819_03815 [Patescibacteria group bacterium]|nr:hypothetical protein [Patescibacteria group bacterium]
MEKNFSSWREAKKGLQPVLESLHLSAKVEARIANGGSYLVPGEDGKLTVVFDNVATEEQKRKALYHIKGLANTSTQLSHALLQRIDTREGRGAHGGGRS